MNKKKLIMFAAFSILSIISSAQTKVQQVMTQQDAIKIFTAWQTGESGKGYNDFKKLASKNEFQYFSHPLIGNFAGDEAYKKLMELVKERETKPNQLRFSNITSYQQHNRVCFQFDSEGKVGNGFNYKGYNIIQFEIKNKMLIGFREYFGFIDTSWFK